MADTRAIKRYSSAIRVSTLPVWKRDAGDDEVREALMTRWRLLGGSVLVGVVVVSAHGAAQAPRGADLVLVTQPEAGRPLARDLPRLVHAATQRARTWQRDAVPVSLEFEYRDAPNPSMRGPTAVIQFFSADTGTGLRAIATPQGLQTSPVNQQVRWGTRSLPVLFLDLPEAVRVARQSGLSSGPVSRATLRVWAPPGAPPIVAWMIGNRTVNAATGDIIPFDVTGYVASYNAAWQRASAALEALIRRTQPRPNADPYSDPWSQVFTDYCYGRSVPTGGQVEPFPGVVCR